MPALPPADEMDRAFRTRDAEYDNLFFVGVKTTGVFCKPSCPARKPLPENIEYFRTSGEALFAGFRPCKRCHPLEAGGLLPEWAQILISRVENDPAQRIKEYDLLQSGLNPATVRRFFQQRFGMTFQAFCRSRRLSKAFDEIKKGSSLDEAALDSGYESLSGFRDAFAKKFRIPPGKGKNEGSYVRLAWTKTPLGPMIAGATDAGICLLEFTERRMLEHQLVQVHKRFNAALIPAPHHYHLQLEQELAEYFNGKRTEFTLPLAYPGTDFQQKVWNELLTIPYGATTTYETMAQRIGSPKAVRAVGTANGYNRIGILIPCHRVINKNGSLGGYGGGLWRKKYLLDLEKQA